MKSILYHIAVISLTIFLMYSCGKKNQGVTEEYKPVSYGIVQITQNTTEQTFNGISQSSSETNLSFRSNGLIVKLNAKVGQKVKNGELLGQLDQKDVLIAYEKANAELRNMEVQLETAKSHLNRVKELYQSNNASLNDYEQAKSGFSNAQSNLTAANRAVDLQKSQIEYTRIVAPMDGVISKVDGAINEFAQAGAPIIVMSSGKADAEVEIGIPESYINKIQNGQNVEVTFETTGDSIFTGTVTQVGYSTMESSTFPVTAVINEPSVNIKPGMSGKVKFKFIDKKSASHLVVPVKAVADDPDGNFVFLLKKQEDYYVVTKTRVEIGDLVSEGFTVVSGLKEGDYVALAGIRELFDGKKVSLLQ